MLFYVIDVFGLNIILCDNNVHFKIKYIVYNNEQMALPYIIQRVTG